MHRLALVLCALAVVGCDSSGPGGDLVGTWTLTHIDSDLLLTSRTAQVIPDYSVTPQSTLTAAGEVTASFDVFRSAFRDPTGALDLQVATDDPFEATAPFIDLHVVSIPNGDQLDADIRVFDSGSGRSFSTFLPATQPFTVSGGRFTVPTYALAEAGTNATVTVGGTLTFPEVQLAAGTPTAIAEPGDETVDDAITFAFDADGSFTATTPDDVVSGTWEALGDDEVRVVISDAGITETLVFGYALSGGVLSMTTDVDFDGCDAQCVSFYEGQYFADPGSFSSVGARVDYAFRQGPTALARTAPTTTPRDARRISRPFVD